MTARIKVREHDDAGKLTATYLCSDAEASSRIDLIPPDDPKPLWQRAIDVFLPAGYPHSVTDDYLEYQIYDSLQAFSSSIAGLLASRAALSSVGVGDSTASPTAALLLSILQESAGRIATILFAHRFGSALEPECKMYRLLADVLNDLGFVLDCLSPIFPKPIRVVILSCSSVLRALCGVAAGSAKASLSAHFARWGNLGELNAKDSSQETVISLFGMLAGSLVVSWVTTPMATWTTLILLLSIHLETNRRAVRAVSMRTLNRQRATLVYHHLRKGHVPTPGEISARERIFERDGVLRGVNGAVLGFCTIGATFSDLLKTIVASQSTSRSFKLQDATLWQTMAAYRDQRYILWPASMSRPGQTLVAVKQDAGTTDLLTAWWQALLLAGEVETYPTTKSLWSGGLVSSASQSMQTAADLLSTHEADLRVAGWDLDTNALETISTSRLVVEM